jgi:hypothetical protein
MDVEGGGKRYQGKEEEKEEEKINIQERKGMIMFHLCPDRYTSYKKITTTT